MAKKKKEETLNLETIYYSTVETISVVMQPSMTREIYF